MPLTQPGASEAWSIVQGAALAVRSVAKTGAPGRFSAGTDGTLEPLSADDPGAILAWSAHEGWTCLLDADDPRRETIELYLPVCSAHAGRPITLGHLGQSLDGFIATQSGDSRYVTGPENILHLHRLRALCDAVIVGAGTVAADDPRLTTRLVPGHNPLRVIIDPYCRLPSSHRVFSDNEAMTVRACAAGSIPREGDSSGKSGIMEVGLHDGRFDLADLVTQLHALSFARIFVEGGGVTVSAFLEAHLLDRIQITVSALFIGDGRPAIRLPATSRLKDCLRPAQRVYRLGSDVLFDCDLRTSITPATP